MNHLQKRWAIQRPGNLFPVFFLSIFFGSYAQGSFPGAYSMARGEVCAVVPAGGVSLINPALLSEQLSAAYIAGHSRPFAIREIGVTSLSGILPVNPGSFRLGLLCYGIAGYRDITAELGYGLRLSETLSAGISFHYYNTTALGDWNYLWTLGWGTGLLYAPSKKTRAGMVLMNPFTVGNHSGYGPVFPSMIALGLSHIIYENTTLFAEVTYSNTASSHVKFAMELMPTDRVTLACGFHSSPSTYAFGAGYNSGNFGVHVATAWSNLPGIHPSIQFTWLPGK